MLTRYGLTAKRILPGVLVAYYNALNAECSPGCPQIAPRLPPDCPPMLIDGFLEMDYNKIGR